MRNFLICYILSNEICLFYLYKMLIVSSGNTGVGVPGAPGAAELAAALRRLTPQEINSRRASLAASHVIRQKRRNG